MTGLNGETINGSVIREQGSSRALSTDSACDNNCLTHSTAAVGFVNGKRCMRWCDSDADLTMTLNETYAGDLLLTVKVLNPPFQQNINVLKLSITGCFHSHGVFSSALTRGVFERKTFFIFQRKYLGDHPD